jgi:hypothetical protein
MESFEKGLLKRLIVLFVFLGLGFGIVVLGALAAFSAIIYSVLTGGGV